MGTNGPVGLDYGVVYRDLDRMAPDPATQDELMDALRYIERAALEQIYKS